jgi:hypothetical protein
MHKSEKKTTPSHFILKKREFVLKKRMELKTSESENGFCSNCFGPLWYAIHMVTLTYPVAPTPAERAGYTTWFELFGVVLPCSVCKHKFPLNLKQLGWDPIIHMKNRHTFAQFVWQLHNHINQQLKKDITVSWEQFNSFYEHLRADDCSAKSCNVKKPKGAQCILRIVPENYPPNQLFCIDQQCVPTCAMTCLEPNK